MRAGHDPGRGRRARPERAKRLLDVVLAGAGLALLSPLLLLVAVAVRLDSRGPVLFRQERVGRHFRRFRILKFRTMRVDAEAVGPGVTPLGDPRVTRLGRLLRETKLDELPQLWNVLCGEMSLVGPRPELERYVRLHPEAFREILAVRPGITDPASLAYRNEAILLDGQEEAEAKYLRDVLPDKLRRARRYVERASLGYDLRILAETVLALAYPAQLMDRLFRRVGRLHEPLAFVFQALLAALAPLAALALRFDGAPPEEVTHRVVSLLPGLVVIRTFWLWRLRLHRDMWRYFGMRELGGIVAAVALGTATFLGLFGWASPPALYPRSVVVLDAMLLVAALAAVRVARRAHELLRPRPRATRSIVLVGDGDAVEPVLHDLASDAGGDYHVVGLVAEDPAARGLRIHDVPVVGGLDRLDQVLATCAPDEIVVLASALPAARRDDAIRRCRASGWPVKVVPDLRALLRRDDAALRVEEPRAEDLLFRTPVGTDGARAEARIRGRRVMVTGAGGTIGAEICRQVCAAAPARLVLFEQHEGSLYHVERDLRARFPGVALDPVIGDVRDAARVRETLEAARPELVFHAAAYKHVPLMERNRSEAYRTNVLGTKCVAEASELAGVHTFVLISSDKAVEPVGVMGATKRMAELTLQDLAAGSRTRFVTVRFGNVLESSGSVLPLFREQIRRGGPVTVTHPDVTRWFMTVAEAVHLILEAAALGWGGEVFVLDMGRPVRILDVAHALIRQYGLTPGEDVPVAITGLRPGERLFEKLFNDHETIWKTEHPRILKAVDAFANGAGEARRATELRRLMSLFLPPGADPATRTPQPPAPAKEPLRV